MTDQFIPFAEFGALAARITGPFTCDDGVTYTYWHDGESLGFKATHRNGRVEYVYLTPDLEHCITNLWHDRTGRQTGDFVAEHMVVVHGGDGDVVRYTPWTDGIGVGFTVTAVSGDDAENGIIYLYPSAASDSGQPSVFVYANDDGEGTNPVLFVDVHEHAPTSCPVCAEENVYVVDAEACAHASWCPLDRGFAESLWDDESARNHAWYLISGFTGGGHWRRGDLDHFTLQTLTRDIPCQLPETFGTPLYAVAGARVLVRDNDHTHTFLAIVPRHYQGDNRGHVIQVMLTPDAIRHDLQWWDASEEEAELRWIADSRITPDGCVSAFYELYGPSHPDDGGWAVSFLGVKPDGDFGTTTDFFPMTTEAGARELAQRFEDSDGDASHDLFQQWIEHCTRLGYIRTPAQ